MRNLFSNKKLIIIMIVVIVTFGMISASVTLSNKKSQPNFIHQVSNDAMGVVGDVIAYPVNFVKNVGNNLSNLFNTYEENRRLKTQVEEVGQVRAQNSTLKKENKALKQQIKLNKTLTDYHRLSASVISRSPNEWQDYLIINKGLRSGVKKNMPVVSETGLIGRVIEVNQTNSKVSLISTDKALSNKFAVEVFKPKGDDSSGIIGRYDKKNNLLVMTNVTSTEGVKKGQQVVTSGLGGLTPRGLFVGKVAAIKKDNYGLVSSIYIHPAADLDNFSVVTVLSRDVADD